MHRPCKISESRTPALQMYIMSAGVIASLYPAAGDRLRAASEGGARARALVVGLGGGGLPAFLARCCGLAVEAVELDPAVVDLARSHFGFRDNDTLRVRTRRPAIRTLPFPRFAKLQAGPTIPMLRYELWIPERRRSRPSCPSMYAKTLHLLSTINGRILQLTGSCVRDRGASATVWMPWRRPRRASAAARRRRWTCWSWTPAPATPPRLVTAGWAGPV